MEPDRKVKKDQIKFQDSYNKDDNEQCSFNTNKKGNLSSSSEKVLKEDLQEKIKNYKGKF